MMEAMRREADQEAAAALARRAKDEALAQAMRESHECDDHPRGSSTEGVARCSSEVKGDRGHKRVKRTQPPVSVRGAAAEAVRSGTAVTVRVLLHRDVEDKAVQTD